MNACVDPRAAKLQDRWSQLVDDDACGTAAFLAELGHPTSGLSARELCDLARRVLTPELVTAERIRLLAEMCAAMDRVTALIWPAG